MIYNVEWEHWTWSNHLVEEELPLPRLENRKTQWHHCCHDIQIFLWGRSVRCSLWSRHLCDNEGIHLNQMQSHQKIRRKRRWLVHSWWEYLEGTNFFAWRRWLMTQWSANERKAVSARFFSHANCSHWRFGSTSTKGVFLRTVFEFLDDCGPTHVYVTGLP